MRKFIEEEKLPVPYTENRYILTIDGVLFFNDIQCKVKDGKVNLEIFEKQLTVSIGWLMAFTFKPLFNLGENGLNWTVLYADSDKNNIHPSNLIWSPPDGGQLCPESKGYYVIPGYSKFAINKDGCVINREYNKTVKTYQEKIEYKKGYVKISSIQRDNGSFTSLGVHRLLGLAFIPYDNMIWKTVINHKNGIKNDNKLDNLEWSTYSYNNIHAMDIGLRNSRKKVQVKNYITGKLTSFKSISHAADFLEVNSGYLLQYLVKKRIRFLKNHFIARFEEDLNEWPEIKKDEVSRIVLESIKRKDDLVSVAINIYNGSVTIAETPGRLASLLSLTVDQVATAVESPYLWPTFNHVFFPLKKPKPLLNFTEEELTAFKNRTGIKNPVKIIYNDGKVEVYCSPSELSVKLGWSLRLLADLLYQNKGKYKNSDFQVEYIKHFFNEQYQNKTAPLA